MLHDVICMSRFVLFNNGVIFVLVFGKTAKLLLSSITWVEETTDSLILVMYLRIKTKCIVLDVYGMSFVINTYIWLVFIDCSNTWIIDEICYKKCHIRRPGQDHLHAPVCHLRNRLSYYCIHTSHWPRYQSFALDAARASSVYSILCQPG